MFVVPPLIYFWVAGLWGSNHLTQTKRNLGVFVLIALGLGFVSTPVIELSWQLNQFLELPPFLDGLEAWMRTQEEVMKDLTNVFLKADRSEGRRVGKEGVRTGRYGRSAEE